VEDGRHAADHDEVHSTVHERTQQASYIEFSPLEC
jgi:hypothetical protein